jgi:hypothetical protein
VGEELGTSEVLQRTMQKIEGCDLIFAFVIQLEIIDSIS